ncbi:Uncharacterised protein [Enterobacter roggenkampii]|nr:Uncharacterised protein [Enterobacter roggenkampii]
MQNEDPIYLAYNTAAFGFTGRSVYQRALYPLKSFIQTMRTDDMVAVKGGLLVTKIKGPSSVVNNMMQKLSGIKRMMLKRGKTGEVLQIGESDNIESIDLSNLEKPLDSARKHILENTAAAADMPAIILNSETFAQGFGEGTEDARAVAVYIDNIREWLDPLYAFFIRVCQYRAWSIEFFQSLRADFPELKNTYSVYFASWINNFEYRWPSSLKEPESEKVKVDETRFKAIVSMLEVVLPQLTADPENRATLIEWACENANANENLFPQRLNLDYDSLKENPPPEPPKTELNATLTQGLDDLSRFQVVTFTKYIRKVLPLDGFVFWVKASVLSDDPSSEPDTVDVKGYLHLTTETIQDDEQLYDRNVVTFTAQADIDPFNDIGSDVLYIGEFFGLQFSFSRRTGLNEPANLYHYTGEAIFPYMRSQIINSSDDIDLADVVVSSSLPVWLTLSQYMPMFPAMLSTQNLSPPYATVKCSNTAPIAGSFYLDEQQNQYQLVSEDVTISITGLRNAGVEDFLRYVQQYTLGDDAEMEEHCLLLGNLFTNFISQVGGLGAARVAAMMLRKKLQREQELRGEDNQQAKQAPTIVDEIQRLTSVVWNDGGTWKTTSFDAAMKQGIISPDEYREVEGEVVFFMVSSAIQKAHLIAPTVGSVIGMFGGQLVSLSVTAFRDSLLTSNPPIRVWKLPWSMATKSECGITTTPTTRIRVQKPARRKGAKTLSR